MHEFGALNQHEVVVSEKPPSSTFVMMGFSADPSSSQGKRKMSTGWAESSWK